MSNLTRRYFIGVFSLVSLVSIGCILHRYSDYPHHTHPAQEQAMSEQTQTHGMNDFFDALWQVESSSRLTPPDGDDGRSVGPYQIQWAYWKDSGVPGDYYDCRGKEYSERVMLKYWARWCNDALGSGDWQTLAMIHNGGPTGDEKDSTLGYWGLVKGVMHGE